MNKSTNLTMRAFCRRITRTDSFSCITYRKELLNNHVRVVSEQRSEQIYGRNSFIGLNSYNKY